MRAVPAPALQPASPSARGPLGISNWVLIILGWTLLGLFRGWQASTNMTTPGYVSPTLLVNVARALTWALLTPWAFSLARRERPLWPITFRFVTWHLFAGLLVTLAQMAVQTVTFEALGLWSLGFTADFERVFRAQLHNNVVLYLVLAGLVWGYDSSTRAQAAALQKARLTTQFAEARLETLNTQLNPPFFFSTLNTILPLIYSDPHAAARLVIDMGDLLRATFKHQGASFVRLADELHTLDLYLKIESTRFGDRLAFVIDMDPSVLEARVPHLILQPFLAQAIAEAISSRLETSRVQLTGRSLDGRLLLTLTISAPPEPPAEGKRLTTPELERAGKRLRHLYGKDLRLSWNTVNGGLLGIFEIPLSFPAYQRAEGGTA